MRIAQLLGGHLERDDVFDASGARELFGEGLNGVEGFNRSHDPFLIATDPTKCPLLVKSAQPGTLSKLTRFVALP